MSDALASQAAGSWTAVDLVQRFGAIPLCRVRHDPAPGTAVEEDVVTIHDREDRLYELIDRTLVAKTVGTYESYLAMMLGRILGNFIADHNLGVVLGSDGMLRLAPGLVRIPDVSFISWMRLPDGRMPNQAIADVVPDLAIEVISRGNTREEMERKLYEYFDVGVRLVWYVYAQTREVRAYMTPGHFESLTAEQILDGGQVLPGFSLPLAVVFADPVQTVVGKPNNQA